MGRSLKREWIDSDLLRKAARALERAASAAAETERYTGRPCRESQRAALAEIACAEELIVKAKPDTPPCR